MLILAIKRCLAGSALMMSALSISKVEQIWPQDGRSPPNSAPDPLQFQNFCRRNPNPNLEDDLPSSYIITCSSLVLRFINYISTSYYYLSN